MLHIDSWNAKCGDAQVFQRVQQIEAKDKSFQLVLYIYIMCIIYIYILLYIVSCLSWLSSASQCASLIPLGPQLQQVVLGDGEAEKEDNKFRWGFASTTGGSNFQIVD